MLDNQSNLLELVTTERSHLVDISHALSKALGDVVRTMSAPVTLSVGGTEAAGKKIFPDSAVHSVLGYDVCAYGDLGKYEIWEKNHARGERDLYVAFINTAYLSVDESALPEAAIFQLSNADSEHVKQSTGKLFVSHFNNRPGVIFVHNSRLFSEENADVSIWLESHASKFGDNEKEQQKFSKDREVSNLFHQFSIHGKYDWTRYVRIEVKNPNLAQNPIVLTALKHLKEKQRFFCPQQAVSKPNQNSGYPYMPRL